MANRPLFLVLTRLMFVSRSHHLFLALTFLWRYSIQAKVCSFSCYFSYNFQPLPCFHCTYFLPVFPLLLTHKSFLCSTGVAVINGHIIYQLFGELKL